MAQGNGTRTGFTPGSAAAAGLQHQKQDGQVSHPSQHDSPSWSCQQTQCAICLEVKEPGDMPFQVTSLCLHEPTVCKDCLKRWLQSDVKSGLWRDGLRCPVCRASLKWHDVKRWVSHETFEHYDRLLLQRTLSKHPTFHACLSPACESGQIYETRCPQFDCVACGQSYCIDHCVPWHANVTCEEYDDKSSLHAFAARASEGFIRTATETCPHCQRRVIKAGGCDHITCICGYQWCYICLEPYALFEGQGQKRIRLCRHKPSCPGHGPLLPPMGRTAGAMDRSPPRPAPDRAAGLYRGRQAGGVGARRWRHATADRFAREA